MGTATADKDPAAVALSFRTDTPVTAVQFEIAFDASRLIPVATAAGLVASRHIVASSEPAPGIRRVVVYSMSNVPLTNGILANISFVRRSKSPDGSVALTVTNAVVSGPLGQPIGPLNLSPGLFNLESGTSATFMLLSISGDGSVDLQLTGPPGRTYAIQASVDLTTWAGFATNVIPVSGILKINDPKAGTERQRFYRAERR